MRPGPGLVVMALAFISGARRGSSTSQQDRQQQQQQHHNLHQTILPNLYNHLNNQNYNIAYNNYLNNNKLGKIGNEDDDDDDYGGTGKGASPLARANPWLSACDLAQPNQAPDLQGQCSAGTLPVAWVDEGPGPPRCPISCEQLRLEEKNKKLKNNKYNNNNSNNYKIDNSHNKLMDSNINNKLNNRNHNNFDSMENLYSNVRNEQAHHQNENTHTKREIKNLQNNQEIPHEKQQYQHEKQPTNQQHQQQCLDYLGDNEESSPAQLCKKSSRELTTKLRSLRLKHCCERNAFSALHSAALNATLNGGTDCIRTLNDLLDLDALATRITCEFTEILVRYDCRQTYSLINHCEDCKEAYRRWVCSTLIPYFAEPEDIRQNTTTSNSINKTESHSAATSSTLYHHTIMSRSTSSVASSSSLLSSSSMSSDDSFANSDDKWKNRKRISGIINNENRYPSMDSRTNRYKISSRTQSGTSDASPFISTAIANPVVKDPLLERLLKRSKRKAEMKRRRKIRPCLSVCQTVEQKCPYMLPADRAPALPTQYAGEPTFLCLDPNIEEVGEQLRKSNNGPDNCCYRYCGVPSEGICAHCQPFSSFSSHHNIANDPSSLNQNRDAQVSVSSKPNTLSVPEHQLLENSENFEYFDEYDDMLPTKPFATCQSFHGTTTSSAPRCIVPYYSSSSSIRLNPKQFLSYHYFLISIWITFWLLIYNVAQIGHIFRYNVFIHSPFHRNL